MSIYTCLRFIIYVFSKVLVWILTCTNICGETCVKTLELETCIMNYRLLPGTIFVNISGETNLYVKFLGSQSNSNQLWTFCTAQNVEITMANCQSTEGTYSNSNVEAPFQKTLVGAILCRCIWPEFFWGYSNLDQTKWDILPQPVAIGAKRKNTYTSKKMHC